MCRYITCANGGICNPVPAANNGIAIECWCLDGKENEELREQK